MGKSFSKITFFFLIIVVLMISSIALGDISSKQLPEKVEFSIKNPIMLYHYPNFFVKEDVLYLDYYDSILMLDVKNSNNINRIGKYSGQSYIQILNFNSYIIGLRQSDNYDHDFHEYNLEVLSIKNKNEIALKGQMTFMVDRPFLEPNIKIFTDDEDNVFCSLDVYFQRAIYLVDCTNPSNPYIAANYSKEILELEGKDFIRNYEFHENYLYALITDFDNFNCTIRTYNITNPLAIVKINDLDFPIDYDLNDFFINESTIYYSYNTEETTQHFLGIYDISNKSNPQLIDELDNMININSIIFHGDYLFLNDKLSIQIFEKKVDKTLEYKKTFQPKIKEKFHDIVRYGKLYGEKILYSRVSSEPSRTFTIINIQDPLNPVEELIFGPLTYTNQISIEFSCLIAEIFLMSVLYLIIKKKKYFLRK